MISLIVLACKNGNGEFEKLYDILREIPEIKMIQVTYDQHQGSFQNYLKLVENIRRAFPDKSIMVDGAFNGLDLRTYERGALQRNQTVQIAIPAENNPDLAAIDVNEGNKHSLSNAKKLA